MRSSMMSAVPENEGKKHYLVWMVAVGSLLVSLSISLSRSEHNYAPPRAQMDSSRREAVTRKPNVILLLAEDLGYGDLRCFGHPYAKTPNIDSIADEGTKHLSFYSTGKVCSPARGGIMTGRYPASMKYYSGTDGFDRNGLTTVTELFHDAGYRTGHVGKWHIGDDDDRKDGVYGIDDIRKRAGCQKAEWYKDECVYDAAIDFIEENQDEPFYLNVWGHVAHSPIKPKEHLADRFKGIKVRKEDFGKHYWAKLERSKELNKDLDKNMAYYLGAIYSMDYNVGRLLDTIDKLGLKNNTIIAFTGDHGAAPMGRSSSTSQNMLGYCGGLRDYKHSYYEGGVRVPLVVQWPGKVPAGRVVKGPMSFLDWLPTACSLADVPYEKAEIHGEDWSDVLLGKQGLNNRAKPLFWNKEGGGDWAMLSKTGTWKLHFTTDNKWELYNLKNDKEEEENLVRCEKGIADKMKNELRAWTKTLPDTYCRRFNKDCDKARHDKLDKGKDGDGIICDDKRPALEGTFQDGGTFPVVVSPVEGNK